MTTRAELRKAVWRIPAALAMGIICCFARADSSAASSDGAAPSLKRPDFSAFRILVDRNIFDPTRKPASAAAKEQPSASTLQSQTVRLMGTLIMGNHCLAFFEGDAEIPREGLELGGSIAGYLVAEVRTDAAVLLNEEETLELRVGAGLTKNDAGAWGLVEHPPVDQPSTKTGNTTPSNPTAETPAQQAGQESKPTDDAAEKLRERRRKELGS